MHDDQIALLETSFAEVSASRDAAALFYERLFVLDPALKRLFGDTDMAGQGEKLFAALGLVVASLRSLDKVVPELEQLAVRHVRYGVRDGHYATVGAALIETLSLYFGRRFTAELRRAWVGAYEAVAGVMMAAARRAAVEGGTAADMLSRPASAGAS
ncbi:globin family protein [Xanthobacter autotrophicus]|uniref:globin family protein n=1 Tax=Xanthobacter autotrophicus TaxID=280 RepID=UPI00372A57FF